MTILKNEHIIQTIFVLGLIILNIALLYNYASWYILLSIFLLKVYQIIGGGGMHLWGCHSLYKDKISNKLKAAIGFFWVLCGINRASYFCKYHIIHHAFCDKEGDPHSPNEHNPLKLTLGFWCWNAKEKDKFVTPDVQKRIDSSNKRLASNPITNFFDKYHYTIIFSLLLSTLYLSPFVCLYFIALPMLLNIIDGNFFFVYYFHKGGNVENYPLTSYWIAGSGNHKVHHKWLR